MKWLLVLALLFCLPGCLETEEPGERPSRLREPTRYTVMVEVEVIATRSPSVKTSYSEGEVTIEVNGDGQARILSAEIKQIGPADLPVEKPPEDDEEIVK